MIFARSILYNLYFYVMTIILCLLILPVMLVPETRLFSGQILILEAARLWGRLGIWGLRLICGTQVEIRGRENLGDGGAIIASKHQSVLEIMVLVDLVKRPTFINKRELFWVPMFGWYMWKSGQIPVDRKGRGHVLVGLNERVTQAVANGRHILIFPEGTRRPVDAEPRYKYGIAALYSVTNMPVVPVGINAGIFWRRRGFMRYPGTVVIEILPTIQPGMEADAFLLHLEQVIEASTNRLVGEARASRAHQGMRE